MANILVTGGAGYIATHALLPILDAGHRIVVLDNLYRGNLDFIQRHPQIVFICGDLLDSKLMVDVMHAYSIEAVLHYAGLAYVEESHYKPEDYYRVNSFGTLTLLQAMIKYRPASPPYLVFSSSCAVYGDISGVPVLESFDLLPVSPYGRSKLCAEWMISDFSNTHKFSSIILRYFNVAGSDPRNQIGECHQPETHLIPLAIEAARTQCPFTIYGIDYPSSDGSAIRDFVHVLDLASAHLLSLEYLLNGGGSSCLNLGSGSGFTVLEIIRKIEGQLGINIPLKVSKRRVGDPFALICDTTKAKMLLGWNPVYSNLDQIISDSLSWDRYCHE